MRVAAEVKTEALCPLPSFRLCQKYHLFLPSKNKENYNKWASRFYDDFVLVYSELNGSIAGVMTPNLVRIDEDVKIEFFQWLKEKGVNIAQK